MKYVFTREMVHGGRYVMVFRISYCVTSFTERHEVASLMFIWNTASCYRRFITASHKDASKLYPNLASVNGILNWTTNFIGVYILLSSDAVNCQWSDLPLSGAFHFKRKDSSTMKAVGSWQICPELVPSVYLRDQCRSTH